MAQHQYIERIVNLVDPAVNQLYGTTIDEARRMLFERPATDIARLSGSFALIANEGKTVRMARSLDRPMRYFLAKQQAGPMLIVASQNRHDLRMAFQGRPRRSVSPQLHPHGTGASPGRAPTHRMPRS